MMDKQEQALRDAQRNGAPHTRLDTSYKPISIGCGCCTNGCICHIHQRYIGEAKRCEYHDKH